MINIICLTRHIPYSHNGHQETHNTLQRNDKNFNNIEGKQIERRIVGVHIMDSWRRNMQIPGKVKNSKRRQRTVDPL